MATEWIEIFWLMFVFSLGACVGSFLNVVVARLPLEKSLIWPGSRCGTCYQPIKGLANLPIISYFLLRGRCRTCGTPYSSRYMWVELGTALCFAALFYADVIMNFQQVDFVPNAQSPFALLPIPWFVWVYFFKHALLMSLLIAASLCDINGWIIPLPLTVTGTAAGLILAAVTPWAWPSLAPVPGNPGEPWYAPNLWGKLPRGIMEWPVWGPLPGWLPRDSIQLGIITGVAGAAAGNLMMRIIKIIFERGLGREALGLGDADLMMMAGAFLGWQMIITSFFFGTFAALFVALPAYAIRRSRYLPFGPGLAIGIMFTLLAWRRLAASLQPFFFDWFMLLFAGGLMGGGMFVCALLLGMRRRE